jgi:hypothetical protein
MSTLEHNKNKQQGFSQDIKRLFPKMQLVLGAIAHVSVKLLLGGNRCHRYSKSATCFGTQFLNTYFKNTHWQQWIKESRIQNCTEDKSVRCCRCFFDTLSLIFRSSLIALIEYDR